MMPKDNVKKETLKHDIHITMVGIGTLGQKISGMDSTKERNTTSSNQHKLIFKQKPLSEQCAIVGLLAIDKEESGQLPMSKFS